MTPRLTVVGSINLDLVATAATLPAPGETVVGATLAQHPGGKGANQALAALRLGADVRLVGRVGADAHAESALALLRADGVDLSGVAVDPAHPTGVALIAVDARGENLIVVASGANAALTPDLLPDLGGDALLCQLELPPATVAAAVAAAGGFVALNLAPAGRLPEPTLRRADLIVVNEGEAAAVGPGLHALPGLIAVTLGARGARLFRDGDLVAEALPPPVTAVDATGAGDAFVAALVVALLEGSAAGDALGFACAAGALACTAAGAQPSLPWRAAVDAAV